MVADDLGGHRAQFGFHGSEDDVGIILAPPEKRGGLTPALTPGPSPDYGRGGAAGEVGDGVAFLILAFDFHQRRIGTRGLVFEVGDDGSDFEFVDLVELLRFGQGGAGHARQFFVHAEVVLQGDRGVGDALRLDADAFLGFHGLVQAVAPAATGHHAPGVLVHDQDLAALHEVLAVAAEEMLGAQGLFEVAQQARLLGGHVLGTFRVLERLAEQSLHVRDADLGQRDGAVLFVDLVILGLELLHQLRHLCVPFQVTGGRPGDDERRARLVNEHVVHLVHDGVVMPPLHPVFEAHGHVVAQVVEAELGVGAVGDVRGIGLGALHQAQVMLVFVRGFARRVVDEGFLAVLGGGGHLQDADGESQKAVDPAHPAAMQPCEVIVDGDEVDAFACQRV